MARPAPTFYVFHGTDELTRAETLANFRSRLGPADTADLNTTFLDGRRATLAELRHACDAIPFLAEKRLVIVEGLLARAGHPVQYGPYNFQVGIESLTSHNKRSNGSCRHCHIHDEDDGAFQPFAEFSRAAASLPVETVKKSPVSFYQGYVRPLRV